MSLFDTLFGNTAADASRAAAGDTYAKQNAAIAGITGFGDQYAKNFRSLYQPYANTGATANDSLSRLFANPNSVTSLPGYQFDLSQGIQGLDRSANANHMLNSGRSAKDVLRFTTGLADKTYGDQIARLLAGTGLGMNANAGIGTGITGQLGTRQSAYAGGMNAADTIGEGNVAAANSQTQALDNLLGIGTNLGGKALGGGFGTYLGKKFFS